MTAKGAATLCFSISVSLGAAGCRGRYADFTLPPLPGSGSTPALSLSFSRSPVLGPGDNGWDSRDALNPSVVWFRGAYYNLYSGFDGVRWQTGLATSSDGSNWVKQGKVLSPDKSTWEGEYIAANGSALVVKDQFRKDQFRKDQLWYWYQAGIRATPQIGLARSEDGRAWRKEPMPVLPVGPYGSWDERGVADPFILEKDGWLYLYYLGQNRARQQQLGVARSRDGVHWHKLRSNPVLALPLPGSGSPDENGFGEPAVFERDGYYWLLYTGRDSNENRSLALVRSTDGVHWTATGQRWRGTESWNTKVICDATVLGSQFWFGGGDVASPDENLHGQIGHGSIQ